MKKHSVNVLFRLKKRLCSELEMISLTAYALFLCPVTSLLGVLHLNLSKLHISSSSLWEKTGTTISQTYKERALLNGVDQDIPGLETRIA